MILKTLLPDDGIDATDGSPQNPILDRLYQQLDRDPESISDREHLLRQNESYWFFDLCLERLHRLPSEVEATLGMREFMRLKAWNLIRDGYAAEARAFDRLRAHTQGDH